MIYKVLLCFVLFLIPPRTKGAVPGTFFWRPRLGIDLAIPTTEPPIASFQPNKENIQAGLVVLLEGYDVLTSMLGLMHAAQFASDDETMNPSTGIYYTGVYRWILRTLNLFPHWLRGNFHDALSVWFNRFKFMDAEVPTWARRAMPWVLNETWNTEVANLRRFRKWSESAFSPFYRFPSKEYHHFDSFLPDTVEEFVFSSVERDLSHMTEESEESKKKREEKLQEQLNKKNVQAKASN